MFTHEKARVFIADYLRKRYNLLTSPVGHEGQGNLSVAHSTVTKQD